METVKSLQGDTLDSIAYRHYGTNDMLEAVIEANRDLARGPVFLPEGSAVKMPDARPQKTTTRLWD